MAIDVGSVCSDRDSSWGAYTIVCKANPANATGTIDYVCLYVESQLSNCEVASFSDGAGTLTTTGNISLGTVAVGQQEHNAPGDFTAFNISQDDLIGLYYSAGKLEAVASGGSGYYYKVGDYIPCDAVAFSSGGAADGSLYATGTEAGGDVTVTPGVINLASACQGETVKCGATLTPDAINLAVSPQAETVKCGTTITPDALNLICSIQEETIKCGVTITPGIQSVLTQIQEGTVKCGVTVSPNVINLVAATQDETVSLPGGVTIHPDVIVLVPQTQKPIILTEGEMRLLRNILANILTDILKN